MKQNPAENEIKVFLASSSELDLERAHIGDLFNDINSFLADADTPVRVRLLKWEVFDPLFKGERKQNEYDNQVKKADIFVVLFRSKVGPYTWEETETAITAHIHNKKPEELYCFIQDCEKRDFDINEIKTKMSAACVTDSFSDINDLKQKLIRILSPRLNALGVTVSENGKFIQICSVNILRKQN